MKSPKALPHLLDYREVHELGHGSCNIYELLVDIINNVNMDTNQCEDNRQSQKYV